MKNGSHLAPISFAVVASFANIVQTKTEGGKGPRASVALIAAELVV